MDWNLYKFFYITSNSFTLKEAASKLGISKSYLGKLLTSLEKNIGHKLFIRSSKGIKMTEDGEKLYLVVKNIYPELEAIHRMYDEEKSNNPHDISGEIKIATTQGLASDWLTRFMPGFLNKHPNVNVSINVYADNLFNHLNENDLAIGPLISDAPGCIQKQITSFVFKLYASKEYLDQFGTPKTVSELKKHKFIGFSGKRDILFSSSDNSILKFKREIDDSGFIININSSPGEVQLAKSGIGIASIASDYIYLKDSGLLNILPEYTHEEKIFLTYLESVNSAHIIKSLYEYLAIKIKGR